MAISRNSGNAVVTRRNVAPIECPCSTRQRSVTNERCAVVERDALYSSVCITRTCSQVDTGRSSECRAGIVQRDRRCLPRRDRYADWR